MTITQIRYAVAVAEAKSMQEAAKKEFISQPNLSCAIKALEEEIGVTLFLRSRSGMQLTSEGREFIQHARLVLEQYNLLENRYDKSEKCDVRFHVSTQHYAFAVNAFIETAKNYSASIYQLSIIETQTKNVIHDVHKLKSDIGIVGFNSYNKAVISKLIDESGLTFTQLMQRDSFAYLWKGHPLAERSEVSLQELDAYPCLVFDQGDNTSLFFTEEAFGSHHFSHMIACNDRASSMECLSGLGGFAIGTGIQKESLNAGEIVAIPLIEKEVLTLGYVLPKGKQVSGILQEYIDNLEIACG